LTSSNKTYRRSRLHTYIAAVLAAGTIGGIGFLYFQIADVTERNAEIQKNMAMFESQIDTYKLQVSNLGEQTLEAKFTFDEAEKKVEKAKNELRLFKGKLQNATDAFQEESKKIDKLKLQKQDAEIILSEFKTIETLHKKLSDENRLLEKQIAKGNVTKFDLEKSIESLEPKLDNLQRREKTADGRVKSLMLTVTDLQDETAKLQANKNENTRLNDAVKDLEDTQASLQKEITTFKKQIAELKADKAVQSNNHQGIVDAINRDRPMRNKLSSEVRDLAEKKSQLAATISGWETTKDRLQESKDDLEKEVGKLIIREAELDGEIQGKKDSITKLQSEITNLQIDLSKGVKARDELDSDINNMRQKMTEHEATIATLFIKQAALDADITNFEKTKQKLGIIVEKLKSTQDSATNDNKILYASQQDLKTQLRAAQANLNKTMGEAEAAAVKRQSILEKLYQSKGRLGALQQEITNLSEAKKQRTIIDGERPDANLAPLKLEDQ